MNDKTMLVYRGKNLYIASSIESLLKIIQDAKEKNSFLISLNVVYSLNKESKEMFAKNYLLNINYIDYIVDDKKIEIDQNLITKSDKIKIIINEHYYYLYDENIDLIKEKVNNENDFIKLKVFMNNDNYYNLVTNKDVSENTFYKNIYCNKIKIFSVETNPK